MNNIKNTLKFYILIASIFVGFNSLHAASQNDATSENDATPLEHLIKAIEENNTNAVEKYKNAIDDIEKAKFIYGFAAKKGNFAIFHQIQEATKGFTFDKTKDLDYYKKLNMEEAKKRAEEKEKERPIDPALQEKFDKAILDNSLEQVKALRDEFNKNNIDYFIKDTILAKKEIKEYLENIKLELNNPGLKQQREQQQKEREQKEQRKEAPGSEKSRPFIAPNPAKPYESYEKALEEIKNTKIDKNAFPDVLARVKAYINNEVNKKRDLFKRISPKNQELFTNAQKRIGFATLDLFSGKQDKTKMIEDMKKLKNELTPITKGLSKDIQDTQNIKNILIALADKIINAA